MALKRNDRPASAKAMRQALKECVVDDEGTILRAPHAHSFPHTGCANPEATAGYCRYSVTADKSRCQSTIKIEENGCQTPGFARSLIIFSCHCRLDVAEIRIAFWGDKDAANMTSGLFSAWQYWVFLAVMGLSQVALLKVPVGLATRRPITRRALFLPVIVTGLMIGLLIIGANFFSI
jgi:hypothetical protein